jgi:hypothetical protein
MMLIKAAPVSSRQIKPRSPDKQARCSAEPVFLACPLSSSRTPRLGRPTVVASRWLRQPRRGDRSQGFGACENGQDYVPAGSSPLSVQALSTVAACDVSHAGSHTDETTL